MKALILVDIQVDFLPGGPLAVPKGDEVVAVANQAMPDFEIVIATQDWHPANHASFASQHPGRKVGELVELAGGPQVLWPDHCVMDTPGAELAHGLNRSRIDHVVRKGTARSIDSYSGFFDNDHRNATGLESLLRRLGTDELFVMGLATDYCVKFTVLDAIRLGFATHVLIEGIRGVELKSGDCNAAIDQMSHAGARMITTETGA